MALQPVPEKLGKLAFEGGQAAVTKAADKVFHGAAGEVISVTNELKRIKEEFSERAREALKWVVTLGIFAFVIAGLGAWFAYENALPVELASLRRPVRLSGTENRHKAVQKSHAEVGFLSGLRPPLITVSGSEKSYRPRKLRWRQISGERWAMSSLLTSMPSDLTWRMVSCM